MTFRAANSRKARLEQLRSERMPYLGDVAGEPMIPMRPVNMDVPRLAVKPLHLWAGIIAAILFVAMLAVAASKTIA